MAQSVGIVTSLTWNAGDPFRTSFETGYGADATHPVPYAGKSPLTANGDYDSSGRKNRDLYKGMNGLNKNPPQGATLIAALGGLVAAHPVVQKATQPFIALIGSLPEAGDFFLRDNDNFCGGIELHMIDDNVKRRDALVAWSAAPPVSDPIAPDQVYLLFNPNSRMSRREANEWRAQAQGGDAIAAAMPGSNDTNEFDRAFRRVANAAGAQRAGVIISSDPFFLQQQPALVTAANNAFTQHQIRTCYPFDLFSTTANPPTHGTAIGFGPDLGAAYQSMGAKARAIANALDGGTPLPPCQLDTAQLPANPTYF